MLHTATSACRDLRQAFDADRAYATGPPWRPHDLLNYAQAEEEFNIKKRTLREWHATRRVKSYVIARKVHFRWIDLHEFVESMATTSAGDSR